MAQQTAVTAPAVYDITDAGRAALSAWLDEPPAPRVIEFEAMLKVFFADAGSIAQLNCTLDAVQASPRERLSQLAGLIEAVSAQPEFPERLHISALSLRLQYAQEAAALRWARWARHEIAAWPSTGDPGRWDTHSALNALISDIHDEFGDPSPRDTSGSARRGQGSPAH